VTLPVGVTTFEGLTHSTYFVCSLVKEQAPIMLIGSIGDVSLMSK